MVFFMFEIYDNILLFHLMPIAYLILSSCIVGLSIIILFSSCIFLAFVSQHVAVWE